MFFLNSTDPKTTSGSNFAIAWSYGAQNCEILDVRTGRTKTGISQFSKQIFLKRFTNFVEKLSPDRKLKVLYSDLKCTAVDYQVYRQFYFVDLFFVEYYTLVQ